MKARPAAEGDIAILRQIRLAALRDAPEAFGSTLDRELGRTDSDWRRWLSPGATFLLEEPDGVRGLAAAVPDSSDPGIVHLMAMWVDPRRRGSGAADVLVGAVVEWARHRQARVVRLNVFETNPRARRVYHRNGFQPTGRTLATEDGRVEVEMERPLATIPNPSRR